MPKIAKKATQTEHPAKTTSGAELLVKWNYSLAVFYVRRMQKCWTYPLGLAQIDSPEQLVQSLIEFETDLLADYADQAGELQRIALDLRREALRVPSESYEASLLKAQTDAALIIEQAKAQADQIINSVKSRAERLTRNEEASADAPQKRAHG